MARGLLDSDAVELGIIAPGNVKQFTRSDYRQVRQWIYPANAVLDRDHLPSSSLLRSIVAAVEDFAPDLIHHWGTEGFWGLLSARGLLKQTALLEIQGIKGLCVDDFYGGLTFSERLRCIGIKEILKCRTMRSDRCDFARWGIVEDEIIRGHRFVDVHSNWVRSHIETLKPGARLFWTDRILRAPFYTADCWEAHDRPTLFCTAAYSSPFKGLHVAIRALGLLRKRFPGVRLRIAGAHQRSGIRQDGYMRWIGRLIRQLKLDESVEWLGPLNAEQLVPELRNAAAAVIPTFVESYCVAFVEAMSIGLPVAVAYTGGTGHLGKDEETCLFFVPGDEAMCAYQLERLLTNRELALRLSQESRKIASVRNDSRRIVEQQLEIYRQVAEAEKRQ
jgi:glycosyltransferase involved in cell wall biosynthesis